MFKNKNYSDEFTEKIKKLEKMIKNKKINFFKISEDDSDRVNLFVDKPTDYKPDIEFQKWLKKKKRDAEIEENKKVSFFNPVSMDLKLIKKISKNTKKSLFNKNTLNEDNKIEIKEDNFFKKTKTQIINYYYKLNLKKYIEFIKSNNNRDYFKFNKYLIMIIDIRKQKPIITVINENKTFLCLTSGIVFKKMKMKEKKNKKSDKMVITMLKLIFNEMLKKLNNNNLLINIKGLNSTVDVLYSTIESYSKSYNFLFLNSQHKRRSKLQFKKLKAIKRKLKKKFTKELNFE